MLDQTKKNRDNKDNYNLSNYSEHPFLDNKLGRFKFLSIYLIEKMFLFHFNLFNNYLKN